MPWGAGAYGGETVESLRETQNHDSWAVGEVLWTSNWGIVLPASEIGTCTRLGDADAYRSFDVMLRSNTVYGISIFYRLWYL